MLTYFEFKSVMVSAGYSNEPIWAKLFFQCLLLEIKIELFFQFLIYWRENVKKLNSV